MTTSTATTTASSTLPAYAVGYLRNIDVTADIATYIERIDATLAPHGGRFIVHGGRLTALEGEWDGDVVIIEFPSVADATQWYASPGYQDILALRTDNAESIVCVVEGLPNGYRAIDKLAVLLGS